MRLMFLGTTSVVEVIADQLPKADILPVIFARCKQVAHALKYLNRSIGEREIFRIDGFSDSVPLETMGELAVYQRIGARVFPMQAVREQDWIEARRQDSRNCRSAFGERNRRQALEAFLLRVVVRPGGL